MRKTELYRSCTLCKFRSFSLFSLSKDNASSIAAK